MALLRGFLLLSLLANTIRGFGTDAAQGDIGPKPNIVLIRKSPRHLRCWNLLIVLLVTDDQDVGTLQRRFLPKIFERLVDDGVLFDNFFVPVSRSSYSQLHL